MRVKSLMRQPCIRLKLLEFPFDSSKSPVLSISSHMVQKRSCVKKVYVKMHGISAIGCISNSIIYGIELSIYCFGFKCQQTIYQASVESNSRIRIFFLFIYIKAYFVKVHTWDLLNRSTWSFSLKLNDFNY